MSAFQESFCYSNQKLYVIMFLSVFSFIKKSKKGQSSNFVNLNVFVGDKLDDMKGIKITQPNVLKSFNVSLKPVTKNPRSE